MPSAPSSASKGFVKLSLAAACVPMLVGLVACAPSSDGESADSATTLVFGTTGGANEDARPYPLQTGATTTGAIHEQLYEGLTRQGNDGGVEMVLAESMEANESLDEWTVHVREGVAKHDGEAFSADDVVYSLNYILDPANNYPASSEIDFVSSVEKVDDLTVKLHLSEPNGFVPAILASNRLLMVGEGSADGEAIGTGPFVLESQAPGQEFEFSRFDDYWGERPGFDDLRIVVFKDLPALTNALRGGQVDVISAVPLAEVPALESSPGLQVLTSDSAARMFIEFRNDIAPFDDVRVREAMRLLTDRQQILDTAFAGFGTIANDINGNNTDCAPPDVPQREQDIERAQELLAEAGVPELEVEIVTENGFSGMLEMIQVYSQQAAEAGVTVTPRLVDTATFLNEWGQWPAYVHFSDDPYSSLATQYYLPGGEENGSYWEDPEYIDLAAKLFGTADPATQCEYITQMQAIEYERGGDIIPVFLESVVVHSDKVKGLQDDLYGRTAYMYKGVTVGE